MHSHCACCSAAGVLTALHVTEALGLSFGCLLSEMRSGSWGSMSCIAQERREGLLLNLGFLGLFSPLFFLSQKLSQGYLSCGVLQCRPGSDK